MTLAQANSIFQKKYPTGEIFAHGFGEGLAESTQKKHTCLCFKEGGKVYSYNDSYENVLYRLGLYIKPVNRWWDDGEELEFDEL